VHNNPINNIDPTGNYCVSADGKYAHGGGCNNSSSKYLGDDIAGDPIISNGKLTGYIGVNGPGTLEKVNYWVSYSYVPGLPTFYPIRAKCSSGVYHFVSDLLVLCTGQNVELFESKCAAHLGDRQTQESVTVGQHD
jgi:hypothetical protein